MKYMYLQFDRFLNTIFWDINGVRYIFLAVEKVIGSIFVCLRVSRLTKTDRNEPERTYQNTKTDFCGYRNGPERTSVGTETDRNRLQLWLKRTSVGTRKGGVGYDRNDPNKIMYVWVGR